MYFWFVYRTTEYNDDLSRGYGQNLHDFATKIYYLARYYFVQNNVRIK